MHKIGIEMCVRCFPRTYLDLLKINCKYVWMLLTVRTHYFSWSEKSNEVNKDFELCFYFDIHIYMKYSTPINGDKH